jgi:ABC-type phosphate transport system substrate-binding protein
MKIFFTILILTFNTHLFAEVSVIVHPSNQNNINKNDILRIFLGKSKSFPNGEQAIPINIKEGETRSNFNELVLSKSDSQLKAYWSKLIFTGKGNPPQDIDYELEVLELISSNPSFIGYIDSSKVTEKVKIIETF